MVLLRPGNSIDIITENSGRIVINSDSIDLGTVSQSNSNGFNTVSFISSVTVDGYGRVTGQETSSVSFSGYATLSSPTFTDTPAAPTAAAATSTTQLATTAFVTTADNLKANLADPTFTGTVTLPANTVTSGMILNGTILDTDINASAAIAATKILGTALVASTVTTKGDIIAATASATVTRLGVGTDGYFLKADSAEATGLKWGAIPTVSILDDVGDVTLTSIANGEFLKWNGSVWVNSAVNLSVKADISNPTFTGTVTIPSGASISGFALLAGPTFTGTPAAPTASAATNTTQIATTAFVRTEVANLVASAPGALDTLNELALALGSDAAFSTTVSTSLGLKAPLASPTFTGTVTLPSGTVTSGMILDGTILNADVSDTAAIALGKIADAVVNTQTASYTAVLGDKDKMIEMNLAGANTFTVPPNSSVAFATGSNITILQIGAGQTTVTAGGGVTINSSLGLKMRTQWSSATLVKRATDTWVLMGDTVA